MAVPISWISSASKLIEHFINYSVNSNQKFLFFWTENPEAFNVDGSPRKEYEPNIRASLTAEFPAEGWYSCYIKRFMCEFMLEFFQRFYV